MLNDLDGLITSYVRAHDVIEYSTLILSVITTGAIWLLVGEILPHIASWGGALVSSAVTVLTIYSLTVGFSAKRRSALELRTVVSRFVGDQERTGFRSQYFPDELESLRNEYVTLKYESTR